MSLKILNKSNTTLKKSRKRTYWSWNVRKTLPESQKMCRNFYFRGHLSTLVAKNTTKSGHFRSKNNAQILLKQVKNFQKFHSMTFLTPKIVKYVTLKWPKLKKIRTKTYKNPQKRLFWPRKAPNTDFKFAKKRSIFCVFSMLI